MDLPLVGLELRDCLFADHAPIGHDAYRTDVESRSQPIDDRDQCLDVRHVAGPQFTAQRSAVAVEYRANDHLLAIGSVVLAVSALSQIGSSCAFKIDRRRIEEDQFQCAEQVATALEHRFLEGVFCATRREGRGPLLLLFWQRLSQPGHGAVDLVQGNRFRPGNLLVLFPNLQAGAITAGSKQAMQYGEKQDPFDRQREPAAGEQALDDLRDLEFFPKPGEDQRRSDSPRGDDGRFPLAMCREHHHRLGEIRPRLQQGVELAALGEPIEPSQRGDHPLLASSVLPAVLDDLQIHPLAGLLSTKKHSGLAAKDSVATMSLPPCSAKSNTTRLCVAP